VFLPAATLQEPPDFNARCGEQACRIERVPAKWQVLSVGRDRRTLRLAYEYGGCQRGDARVSLSGTGTRVRIALDVGEVVAIDAPDPRPVCTLVLYTSTAKVRLRHPVAGRPIVGDSAVLGWRVRRVPRVIDLAFADARAALLLQDFHVRRAGPRRGRVVSQAPGAGVRDPGATVILTVRP